VRSVRRRHQKPDHHRRQHPHVVSISTPWIKEL
jgi:hypothetical protein